MHWQDWAAALRIAARRVRERAGADAPVYFVGFSTGGALSVEYALARLEGEQLPRIDGIVLLSPAIGVDPLAWLAVWQSRVSRLPGLHKLAWLDVAPEYDPYKYASFPVNAGQQIYELTTVIDERMTQLAAKGPVRGFPRTIVFQSVADADGLAARGDHGVDVASGAGGSPGGRVRHQSPRRGGAIAPSRQP